MPDVVDDAALAAARRHLDTLARSYCGRCGRVMFVPWRTPPLHTAEHCDAVLAYLDDLERRQKRRDYSM